MTEPIDQATKVMSNTDGEDTQRKTVEEILQGCLQGLSVRIPHILIRYVHIAMQTYADQELASLREQLKQKEEVIRQLIPIAEYGVYGYMRRSNGTLNWVEQEQIAKTIIEKAKNLSA